VARTRGSVFFLTDEKGTFFFAAGQFEVCRGVPRAGLGEGGGEFLDIGLLFVRYVGVRREYALTARRTIPTFDA